MGPAWRKDRIERRGRASRHLLSPLCSRAASVNGARGVIINVTGGPDLSLVEVSEGFVHRAGGRPTKTPTSSSGAVIRSGAPRQGEDHRNRHRFGPSSAARLPALHASTRATSRTTPSRRACARRLSRGRHPQPARWPTAACRGGWPWGAGRCWRCRCRRPSAEPCSTWESEADFPPRAR